MGDKEIGVSKKRSIFFTCIFDGTDKHAPDHEIHLAARTAFLPHLGAFLRRFCIICSAKSLLTFLLHKSDF